MIMKILVCAATANELSALAPEMLPHPDDIAEMRPMIAEARQNTLIFMATGVGPVNAAMAMGYALGLTFDEKSSAQTVDLVLCAGVAGSFDLARTPLCSLWRVSEEIWPEYGLHDGTSVTARAFRYPLWKISASEEVYDRIKLPVPAVFRRLKDLWPDCVSLTVAGVTASFARREKLWDSYHAELENMEGFSVAYAAARAQIPCMEVRSVSNRVGPRSRDEKNFAGAIEALGRILPLLNLI